PRRLHHLPLHDALPISDAFKLISKELGTICEYLCTGQQVVLPPSIHPETNKPYVANTNLYEVLDQLPMIPDDLEERLRNLIEMRDRKSTRLNSSHVKTS